MHTCPEDWVAIQHAVVYYALADRAFSAGIKCWHCTLFTVLRGTICYSAKTSISTEKESNQNAFCIQEGPALTAVWSKALPLTAS